MSRASTKDRPRGFTLVELLISISLTVIIMGGLTSAILVSGQALDGGDGSVRAVTEGNRVLNDIASELKVAVSFDEAQRTPTGVVFTVPDRDDDGQLETIRYTWSGAAGEALTRSYNDSDPIVVAADVHQFDLSYQITTIEGTGGSTPGGTSRDLDVLLVVRNPENLRALETARKFLIESWGHAVSTIDDDAEQVDWDQAIGFHDLVYVPEHVTENDLDLRLRDAPVGVVSEHQELAEELDLYEDDAATTSSASIIIDDNTHYITRPYFAGLLPIQTDNKAMHRFGGPIAFGAIGLAHLPGRPEDPVFLVLDAGASGYSGAPVPGRRVILPWGQGFEFLNETGQAVMRRSIEWAGNAEAVGEQLATPLFSQHGDPTVSDDDHEVKHDEWAAASIVPALPADCVSWKPTRFRFMGRQKGDPLSTLSLQVRGRAFGGQPTALVLDQASVPESALPLEFGWVEVNFSSVYSLPPGEGVCITIGTNSGSGAADVFFENGLGEATEANQFWWGEPGDWDTNVSRDIPCELDGTVETAP